MKRKFEEQPGRSRNSGCEKEQEMNSITFNPDPFESSSGPFFFLNPEAYSTNHQPKEKNARAKDVKREP